MASGQQSRSGLGWTGGMAPGLLWPDSLDSNNHRNKGFAKLPHLSTTPEPGKREALIGLSMSVQGRPLG